MSKIWILFTFLLIHDFLWPVVLFAVLDFYRQGCFFKDLVAVRGGCGEGREGGPGQACAWSHVSGEIRHSGHEVGKFLPRS